MPAKTKGAGGPKTDEGKALVGQNAVRHGAMSLTVPPAELAAYGVHLAGVLASLAPVGYLEERLAERVAMSLWRLRRLELWEAATLSQAQAKALRAIAVSDVFDRAADLDTPAAVLTSAELRLALKALGLPEEEVRAENPDAMRKVAADHRARGELLCGLENLKTPATPRAFKEILTNDGAVCDLAYTLIDRLRAREVKNAAISVAMGADPETDPLDLCDWSGQDLAGLWNLAHETRQEGDPDHETPGWFAYLEGSDQTRKAGRLEELATRAQELADDQGARLVFELDPCHPADRLAWIPARNVYALPSDGLALPWEGRVWLNPPYGLETPRWLTRLAKHGNGIALVFARPDTAWFHAAASSAGAVLFLQKRIRFVGTDGKPRLVADKRTGRMREGSPGAGSMLIAWGADNVAALERSGLGILMTVKAGAA